MGDQLSHAGFLRRLLKDSRANTMALGAAAILPLVGVIGGGVDASRTYLAKARLQQACDSAALAARKQLAGGSITGGVIPSDIVDTADAFFDNNFEAGIYGTGDATFTLTADGATKMDGVATVPVETTLMSIFGFDTIDLAVDCSAELELPNIDVVLVLDNSGSMGGSRLSNLQDAVFAFYDSVMSIAPANARVRFAIVPYSSGVNVGKVLMDKNPNFIANSFDYQSREARFETITNDDGVDEGDVLETSTTTELLPRTDNQLGSTNDAHYHWNDNNEKKFKPQCLAYEGQTYQVDGVTWKITNVVWLDEYWTAWKKGQKAACRGDIEKTTVAGPGDVKPPTTTTRFQDYLYREFTDVDTSAYKLSLDPTQSAVSMPVGTEGAMVSSRWNGCIEERATVATTNFSPIPTGALDLDIDLVPNAAQPDTQWKPLWPGITFYRPGPAAEASTTNRSTRAFHCPTAARELREYPLDGAARNSDFETYINSMVASGNTLHDIGVIWGARLLSPTGIFAAENATAPNGDPISRHLIFMTDGEMFPPTSATSAFGNYDIDGRFAGFAADGSWSTNQLRTIHNARLDAVCERIKNQNITVWTVSFELALNDHTRGCATGDSRAFAPGDAASLTAAFEQIASSIAELRLTE